MIQMIILKKDINLKKIVITGALGHIGSKFIRSLPQEVEDIEMIMIDNILKCSIQT